MRNRFFLDSRILAREQITEPEQQVAYRFKKASLNTRPTPAAGIEAESGLGLKGLIDWYDWDLWIIEGLNVGLGGTKKEEHVRDAQTVILVHPTGLQRKARWPGDFTLYR